jgi:hypothetical protein
MNKGGIFTIKSKKSEFSDFGWVLPVNKTQHVTHWWHNEWKWNIEDRKVNITGHLVPHKEKESGPIKHIILRILSFFLGNRIISVLKKQLIFKKRKSRFIFDRNIEWNEKTVIISDSIYGINPNQEIIKAPRSSKRHVASADSYHIEDFILNRDFEVKEQSHVNNNIFESKVVVSCC